MCRLFGLTAGPARAWEMFWQLDATDSSKFRPPEVDGSGVGFKQYIGTAI